MFNPSLPYGELKFERLASKILFLLNKRLNKRNHNSKYIENFGHKNPSKKSSLV